MNSGTIIGVSIGLPIGGVAGVFNPALMRSVYPYEWQERYQKNGAILLMTAGYGAVGGMVGGAIGGSISRHAIHDLGLIGGAVGGAVGGTVGAAMAIYRNFLNG